MTDRKRAGRPVLPGRIPQGTSLSKAKRIAMRLRQAEHARVTAAMRFYAPSAVPRRRP